MIGLLAAAAAAFLGACGSGGGASVAGHAKPAAGGSVAAAQPAAAVGRRTGAPRGYDPRNAALACIRQRGVDARLAGDDAIQVGDSPLQPRIVFSTDAAATSRSLQGKAQGAEQIGDTLLYVRQGSGAVLSTLELCLDKHDG